MNTRHLAALAKSIRMLGFLITLLGLAIFMNLLTLLSINQINQELEQLQTNIRWQLGLTKMESAWLEQGLLLRRQLLPLGNTAPTLKEINQARENWETQVADMKQLSNDPASIAYLASLAPMARSAFQEAVRNPDPETRQALINRAFSTNQTIDFLLEEQSFIAAENLDINRLRLDELVRQYNLIGLTGISLFGLVGLWILRWASRLPHPLLTIRMALAAAATGQYNPQSLSELASRSDLFGELSQATSQAIQHMQQEELALETELAGLREQLNQLRRNRLERNKTAGEEKS